MFLIASNASRGSSKIYVNACIHICFRVGFHCYAMEFCFAKRTKNICVCMQTHIFLQCGVFLCYMDVTKSAYITRD